MKARATIVTLLLACGSTPLDQPDASDAASDASKEAVGDGPGDVINESNTAVDTFQCGTIVPTGSTSTTYQINARHDGVQPSDTVALPLCKRWTRPFAGPMSYPVVADGRVFVTVADFEGGQGSNVYALDEQTGANLWGPVSLDSEHNWSALTYDAGRLFALDQRGMLTAFEPATGKIVWQTLTPSYASSAPTAWGGRVYFSAGVVYAIDQFDGTLAWSQPISGTDSSPTVDITGVYASFACDETYSFDPSTGSRNWFHSGPCEGGGLSTAALHSKTVFIRDYFGNLMLAASSGVALASFYSGPWNIEIPSFIGDDTLLRVENGSMDAWNFVQQSTVWTFAGDGKLSTPAVVASSTVIVGSSAGVVYALDAADGTLLSSDDAGAAVISNEGGGEYGMTTSMAVADGRLFVTTKNGLVAY